MGLIYVRSRRPIVTFGASALACAVVFGLLAAESLRLPQGWIAGVPLVAGSLGAFGVAGWAGFQLHLWPSGKLALFRDRLVVVQGRHEMRALWDLMGSVTLADARAWPRIRVTDRLTIHFRNEPPIRFKPAHFGLEASACRDLILRFRDDAGLRGRLPEFDSERDLAMPPVVAEELSEPRF